MVTNSVDAGDGRLPRGKHGRRHPADLPLRGSLARLLPPPQGPGAVWKPPSPSGSHPHPTESGLTCSPDPSGHGGEKLMELVHTKRRVAEGVIPPDRDVNAESQRTRGSRQLACWTTGRAPLQREPQFPFFHRKVWPGLALTRSPLRREKSV